MAIASSSAVGVTSEDCVRSVDMCVSGDGGVVESMDEGASSGRILDGVGMTGGGGVMGSGTLGKWVELISPIPTKKSSAN